MNCFKGFWRRNTSIGKPVKVQDVKGLRKIGIVARSLGELKKKLGTKFQVPVKDITLVLAEDGTEVDDEYFPLLQDQTNLVLLKAGEEFLSPKLRLEDALDILLDANHWRNLVEEISVKMQNQMAAQHMYLLSHLVAGMKMTTGAETREDDPDWFKDVNARFKTKDSFMREKARCRMRGFFYHAKDFAKNSLKMKAQEKKRVDEALQQFSRELKKWDYFGDYFARSSGSEVLRYCDMEGWFPCQGRYDELKCNSEDHLINPYGGRECRILFSSWELDHVIEKSREVLPRLLDAARLVPAGHAINWTYFFDLLFTRKNLKLVHPVCHDKCGHTTAVCDPELFHVKVE